MFNLGWRELVMRYEVSIAHGQAAGRLSPARTNVGGVAVDQLKELQALCSDLRSSSPVIRSSSSCWTAGSWSRFKFIGAESRRLGGTPQAAFELQARPDPWIWRALAIGVAEGGPSESGVENKLETCAGAFSRSLDVRARHPITGPAANEASRRTSSLGRTPG